MLTKLTHHCVSESTLLQYKVDEKLCVNIYTDILLFFAKILGCFSHNNTHFKHLKISTIPFTWFLTSINDISKVKPSTILSF